jgi:exonuclease V gamma subunit
MLLGYAMESRQGEWQSILPYDESSGLIAELVGHLASLLMQLNTWRQDWRRRDHLKSGFRSAGRCSMTFSCPIRTPKPRWRY